MSSSKDFRDFILDQSRLELHFKSMMGEYLIYYKGKYIGGLFDDRLLLKKTKTNAIYDLPEGIPYPGANAMLQVDADERDMVRELIIVTEKGIA